MTPDELDAASTLTEAERAAIFDALPFPTTEAEKASTVAAVEHTLAARAAEAAERVTAAYGRAWRATIPGLRLGCRRIGTTNVYLGHAPMTHEEAAAFLLDHPEYELVTSEVSQTEWVPA